MVHRVCMYGKQGVYVRSVWRVCMINRVVMYGEYGVCVCVWVVVCVW